MLKKISFIIASLLLLMYGSAANTMPRGSLAPGGLAILKLGKVVPGDREPRAYFQGQRVLVIPSYGDWHAVVGLPLNIGAGEKQLILDWRNQQQQLPFNIPEVVQTQENTTLKNPKSLQISDDDTARSLREIGKIKTLTDYFRETSWPVLDFQAPLKNAVINSDFGVQRLFNGKKHSTHTGIDYTAETGTDIHAPATANVLAIGNYFLTGNTVVLDHGQGLITVYAHLQKIYVQPTNRVAQGTRIGTVGSSGRTKGSQLHWSVFLNGTEINPQLLLPENNTMTTAAPKRIRYPASPQARFNTD